MKKLITEPGNPNLIISAAEDSTGEPPAVLPPNACIGNSTLSSQQAASEQTEWHMRKPCPQTWPPVTLQVLWKLSIVDMPNSL